MSDEQLKYAEDILNILLKIKSGDALRINTEEKDFEFARIIALKACEITQVPVKIIITENGKPTDKIDIENKGFQEKILCYVLLRIQNSNSIYSDKITNDLYKYDLPFFQKYNHLAEPINFSRCFAVPWCVVPSYYCNKVKIDSELISLTERRIQNLNTLNLSFLSFKAENTDFSIKLPENTEFVNSKYELKSKRSFISSVFFDKIYRVTDCNSLNGVFEAETTVFRKKIFVKLAFENGNIITNIENSLLKKFLSLDNFICKPGYISLRDKEFNLYFGGAITDGIKLKNENDYMPSYLNSSLYSICFKLKKNIDITGFSSNTDKHLIVKNGLFID